MIQTNWGWEAVNLSAIPLLVIVVIALLLHSNSLIKTKEQAKVEVGSSSSSKIYVRFCCPVAGESSNHSNSANWFLYHSQAGNDAVVLQHQRVQYKS